MSFEQNRCARQTSYIHIVVEPTSRSVVKLKSLPTTLACAAATTALHKRLSCVEPAGMIGECVDDVGLPQGRRGGRGRRRQRSGHGAILTVGWQAGSAESVTHPGPTVAAIHTRWDAPSSPGARITGEPRYMGRARQTGVRMRQGMGPATPSADGRESAAGWRPLTMAFRQVRLRRDNVEWLKKQSAKGSDRGHHARNSVDRTTRATSSHAPSLRPTAALALFLPAFNMLRCCRCACADKRISQRLTDSLARLRNMSPRHRRDAQAWRPPNVGSTKALSRGAE